MTEFHIIEIDMIDLPYDITTHEAAILGGCHDIVEVDAAHLAAASVGLALGKRQLASLLLPSTRG